MMSEFLSLIIPSLIFAFTLMIGVWFICMKIRNASFVDVAWAYSFATIALIVLGVRYPELGYRQLGLLGMYSAWSLRLSLHLFKRIASHHPIEDGRYRTLRKKWAQGLEKKFLLFFLLQGVMAVFLSVPMFLIAMNSNHDMGLFQIIGMSLWVVAVVGETISDYQLAKFKLSNDSVGKTCRQGLWKYSRHPNYFFEWIIWVSFSVYVFDSNFGWVAISCPLLMLYSLLKVTGIPATEEQAVLSRGDDYIQYQKTTSRFIPWFPKKI